MGGMATHYKGLSYSILAEFMEARKRKEKIVE
jgi:hypothetical protein